MDTATLIGALAAICSTVSFAPQAIQIIRTRKTEDISVAMYLLTVTGFVAWTTYGVMLGKWPLIAANGICLVLSSFILAMKVLPQKSKNTVAKSLTPN
jgi:MtN3 and saliva related transmembrane protein